jgi:shikimate kinase
MPKPAHEAPRRSSRLVLVGMMGSGKTTVGKLVADRLGVTFADSDSEIESSTGLSVEQLFSDEGEPAFRRHETEVLAHLLEPVGPGVIAAGGGAVLDEANRSRMQREATVAWLRTTVGTITDRVGSGGGRPLLAGSATGRLAAITEITESRADLYGSVADFVVDTDDRAPEAVADAVVAAFLATPARRS